MVASGRAKAARRHVFRDQGDIEDLSPALQRYMNKKINRVMNDIQGKNFVPGFEARTFPCQGLSGKTAIIPINAEPVYNEDDGKWYLDGELIVSATFKKRERAKNKQQPTAVVNEDGSAADAAILNLEPEVLGYEDE